MFLRLENNLGVGSYILYQCYEAVHARSILNNYNPVSNLSYVPKLTEKAMAKQVHSYIAQEGISNNTNQSTYTAFHSAETALLKIDND